MRRSDGSSTAGETCGWLFGIPADADAGADEGQCDEGQCDEGQWDEGQCDEGQEMPPELRYVSDSVKGALAGLRDPRTRG